MDGIKSIEKCPPFPIIEGVQFRHCNNLPGIAVTNTGTVWSCRAAGKDHLVAVKPWKQRQPGLVAGYPCVIAIIEGKTISRYVHRLVLETFIGRCPKGMECRHLNGNKLDNRIENLAWGTSLENKYDCVRHGTCHVSGKFGEQNYVSKLKDTEIRAILDSRGRKSASSVASQFHISTRYVYQLWSGKRRRLTTNQEPW